MDNDYYWLNHESSLFLKRGYLEENENARDRIRDIANAAEKILGIKGFAEKFELYMARGWISLASPVWANFGKKRGLPCSCNGSYIEDDLGEIIGKVAEVGMMTKHGAGTSAYFGALRPRGAAISSGGKSSGSVHFMELFQATSDIISQSNVRRGSFAAYLPVDHPDIEEFLKIKGEGFPIQHISFGVCIPDDWMNSMIDGDKKKRSLWAQIIKKRFETGYPYLFFSDTANKNKPQVYKDKGLKIHASNLCSEIFLSSDQKNSFVCNLSSVNLLHYDEWKKTDLVETMIYFLDAVMSEYIDKTPNIKYMDAAHNFAKAQRALGLGVLGWHSYLQSKMIPFESMEAKMLNVEIFKLLNERSLSATKELANMLGEPSLLKGYGQRNTTRLAVAPTISSSFILGQVSPSIEPLNSNYFVKDLSKGRFTYKNPYLADLLSIIGKDNDDVWSSILTQGGSVQHLDFLTQEHKEVFKTFGEISQKEIVIQASARQRFIDQGQSLNLMIPLGCKPKEASDLLIEGWRLGIKSFYYQRGANPAQSLARSILSCKSCEG